MTKGKRKIPLFAKNPEKVRVISDGIGISAASKTVSKKTPK